MFREFFLAGSRTRLALAWGGLVVFFVHALYRAWLKAQLNEWYARFYDLLGTAAAVPAFEGASGEWEPGSGAELAPFEAAAGRAAVWAELRAFALLVAPMLLVHPLGRYAASRWGFSWRVALMRSYLAHYDPSAPTVEGAAQRVHEDTGRFEQGIYGCCTAALDSVLTLCVFVPLLLKAGAESRAPVLPELGDAWLVLLAVQSAAWGLLISVWVARRLVDLEVANQRAEAQLRTQLVLLEQSPGQLLRGSLEPDHEPPLPGLVRPVAAREPLNALDPVLRELRRNYAALFREFAIFNAWVAGYEQFMVLLPMALVAPLLFADRSSDRLSLGSLMRVTNAFDKVFGALAVVAQNWTAVNDFRSTLRRLLEFERSLYGRRPFCAQLLDAARLRAGREHAPAREALSSTLVLESAIEAMEDI
jgi:peptide/bleomycin uptake transporter